MNLHSIFVSILTERGLLYKLKRLFFMYKRPFTSSIFFKENTQ